MATVNQPTIAPSRKVTAGGLSGAVVTVGVWVADYFFHVEIPPYVAAALILIVMFAVSYIVPSSTSDAGDG